MAVSVLTAAPRGLRPRLRRCASTGLYRARLRREVTSLYGRWAYMPSAPGLIQGRQLSSGVVDPKTGDQVGRPSMPW